MNVQFSKSTRIKASVLLIVMATEMLTPAISFALTGGPSQPEVQSFEPVGTSEMVDLFSGDFNYNIPLLDVNGYPVNIAYHAGASMDEEASWVGLGWNINPGNIGRGMRGLPDDMNGEDVTKEFNVKDNWTLGLKASISGEVVGKDLSSLKALEDALKDQQNGIGFNLGLKYNRYKGVGYSFGASLSHDFAKKAGLNAGLSMDYSDDGGLDISPDLSYTQSLGNKGSSKFRIGTGINSRSGLKGLNIGVSASKSFKRGVVKTRKGKNRTSVTSAGGANAGVTYTSALQSYTPSISSPMSNLSVDFSFRNGAEVFGITGDGMLRGNFSNQWIQNKDEKITKKGYGYMYEQEAPQGQNPSNRDYLLDFNRENDGQLMQSTPFLPWVNHSFDMYSVSAQGVGGTYRLHRNDLPMLHDDYRNSKTVGSRAGVDIDFTGTVKGGGNLGFNYSKAESGAWLRTNGLEQKIGFVSKVAAEASQKVPQYEPAFFRDVNEIVPQNTDYLANVGGDQLLHPEVSGDTLLGHLNKDGGTIKYNGKAKDNASKARTPRNKLFAYRTANESAYCLDKTIKSYPINALPFENGKLKQEKTFPRSIHNANHISEVEIVNNDGSRHVFGIPAYNNIQIEKSFRVGQTGDPATGLVPYSSKEASTNNTSGRDGMYSSTTTPAHAHSYLLTGVLSPDYVDLSDDGITDDDLGSAVKINYTRVEDAYQWRTPYLSGMAKYAKGNNADNADNMGSYVYGTKEIWNMHSIEGKTHIALFEMSDREDGLGVNGENGEKNTDKKLQKLDRIKLYSKREVKEFGLANAVPIKTVHFVYNYESCKGVVNQAVSGDGKLTLEKIYFTYGASNKGRLNAYRFDYNQNDGAAYQYNLQSYDAWGTFSPVQQGPTNAEFPFTTQDSVNAAEYASLWNLKTVHLPSGGTIHVAYEADTYGYVQDKRAMGMFKIKSFGKYENDENDTDDFQKEGALYGTRPDKETYDIIFFDLEKQLPNNTLGRDELRKRYLNGIGEVQVMVNVEIAPGGPREYIKTYIQPAYSNKDGSEQIDCGIEPDGTGWFRFDKVHIRDNNKGEMINPIAKAAWQYTRMNLDFIINPAQNNDGTPSFGFPFISSFVGMFNDLAGLIAGANRMLMSRKFCRKISPNRSWVRLNDPDRIRYGGGHRVKSITMSDNWNIIVGDDIDPSTISSAYGQEYDYSTIIDGTETISSGVATFEPSPARDVNPFVKPEYYDQLRKGVPDSRYTFEHPIGESFYPGASVGYSKITVSSIRHTEQSESHRTGYQVSEFFTYKDYPTESYASDIDAEFPADNFLSKFSFSDDQKRATAAQGFIVVLNDMHGKPKANWSYNEFGDRLSGVAYTYQMDDDGKLTNDVLAMNKDNTFSEKTFGVNVDFAADSRRFKDEFFSADVDVNLDAFVVGVVPIFIPSIWPSTKQNESEVKTATTMKVVRKLGLLQTTTAYKEGSKIETENLLYDGSTGQVLLTSVDNEFGDKVYSFNYPAHWAYDEGMGQAFQNWGLELKGIHFNGGLPASTQPGIALKDYVVPGDVCLLNRPGKFPNMKVWITGDDNGNLIFIDAEGNHVYHYWPSSVVKTPEQLEQDQATTLRVMRSGRRNMASVSVGSVTCMKNPLVADATGWSLDFDEVLATSAVEYKDKWKTDMSLFARYECDTVPSEFLVNMVKLINTEILPKSDSLRGYFTMTGLWGDRCTDTTIAFHDNWEQEFASFSSTPCFLEDIGLGPRQNWGTEFIYKMKENCSDSGLIINTRYASVTNVNDIPPTDPNIYNTFSVDDSANDYCTALLANNSNLHCEVSNYLDTNCLDIDSVMVYCKQNIDFFYKKNGSIYTKTDDTSYIYTYKDEKTPSIGPVLLGDTIYVKRTISGQPDEYLPFLASQIIDCVDDVNTWFSAKTETKIPSPRIALLDSILSSSDIDCDGSSFLGTVSRKADRYIIKLNSSSESSQCDNSCKFNIYTDHKDFFKLNKIINVSSHQTNFKATLECEVYNAYGDLDTIKFLAETDCAELFECQKICTYEARERKVNPYLTGIKGNWRPHTSWTFVGDRSYRDDRANPKGDGKFTKYYDFWAYSDAPQDKRFTSHTHNKEWVWTSEVTAYSPFGMELENRDPLGRYSAAKYGYSQTLPTAVASNTRHRQLWYEGFEEYGYLNTLRNDILCPQFELPYTVTWEDFVTTSPWLDKDISHTGNVSLRIDPADSLIQEIALNPNYVEFEPRNAHEIHAYAAGIDDQIIPFRPTPGAYIASVWIREENLSGLDTSFDNSYMVLETEDIYGDIIRNELRPTGLIIEGWQRVEVKITLPEAAEILRIKFKTDGTKAWFDDFRIFPYDASMKSYAYDDRTLRLMAELDENNYATLYEYDLEGNLVRIKKETIRGIKTLQESRQFQKASTQ